MVSAHRAVARGNLSRSRIAGGRAQCRARLRRRRRQGADRASRHQGDRLCRRKRHRLRDHAAGRGDAEARAFRTRRQESGDRVRRCRYRPRARCLPVHDLLAERRALHLVQPRAGRGLDLRRVRQARRRARQEDQGRPSARCRDRDRPADPSAPCREGAELCQRRARGRRHGCGRRRPRRWRQGQGNGQFRRADALHQCPQRHDRSRRKKSSARCSP